jgi:hypothetical protein
MAELVKSCHFFDQRFPHSEAILCRDLSSAGIASDWSAHLLFGDW